MITLSPLVLAAIIGASICLTIIMIVGLALFVMLIKKLDLREFGKQVVNAAVAAVAIVIVTILLAAFGGPLAETIDLIRVGAGPYQAVYYAVAVAVSILTAFGSKNGFWGFLLGIFMFFYFLALSWVVGATSRGDIPRDDLIRPLIGVVSFIYAIMLDRVLGAGKAWKEITGTAVVGTLTIVVFTIFFV